VYYYNRSTAASQWHLPNEFYPSTWEPRKSQAKLTKKLGVQTGLRKAESSSSWKMMTTSGMTKSSSTSSLASTASMMFPGNAKGLRKIDCVTEAWLPVEEKAEQSADDGSKQEKLRELVAEEVLRVCIIRAQNLRDADFSHESWDKSDPYCRCEIMGKPDSVFETPVLLDKLDPEWNHEGTIGRYLFDMGGFLVFHVLDYDPKEAGMQSINFQDDKLGIAILSLEDAMTDWQTPKVLELEDAGHGRKAYLTVEVSPASAWPELVGMEKTEAEKLLKGNRPDLSVELYEPQPAWNDETTYSVTSWDLVRVENGYDDDFFSVRMKDLEVPLNPGDTIEIFPDLVFAMGRVLGNRRKLRRYIVDHVEPQSKQAPNGDAIAYIFVEGGLGKLVMDNMQWRRLPKAPSGGFNPQRVCMYYNAISNKIVSLPRTG